MLKRLWLRWQCWKNNVCTTCGNVYWVGPYTGAIHCDVCDARERRRIKAEQERLTAAVRAIWGKP